MIVTTSGRASEATKMRAQSFAEKYNIRYEPRKKRSITQLYQEATRILVFGAERDELFTEGSAEPFFFHPNMALIRYKRLLKGDRDPLLEIGSIQPGDSVLDCTLGRGADSIILSYGVGSEGSVTALEKQFDIHYITATGLAHYEEADPTFCEAMRRIQTHCTDAYTYLQDQGDASVDHIYLDPLFDAIIEESTPFENLRTKASRDELTAEWVEEAKRVAKKSIILKGHYTSPLFERFGFDREVRQTSKFHYGVIQLR